ncbi:hypothetical protein PMZ80_004023 [Knufia obscura]|uniref:Uncharacterized protein n=2 Tax=Knufia TaxID=430999 RepID=A0AAN8I7B4_9EURO|nr:hypothetical protein PMZ80_004023 [Knufia obscura]KAK5952250.1 hypothetical protein OHC33_006723 [Knufia fluminis]
MATRARTRSVANAVPHLKSIPGSRSSTALQLATDLVPEALTDTATSTPSSYKSKQTTELIASPASSRTSLSTNSSTTLQGQNNSTMPPKKSSPQKASTSEAAQTTDANKVEHQGRPTRKAKPTTKAQELADNSTSKLYKSLKKTEPEDTPQEDDSNEQDHVSASNGLNGKTSALATSTRSPMKPAKGPSRQRSPTPEVAQPEIEDAGSADTVNVGESRSRPKKTAGEAGPSASSGTAAPSRSKKRKHADESDEMTEALAKKQKTSPAAATRSRTSKRPQEQDLTEEVEHAEAELTTPTKRPTRSTKAPSKSPAIAELSKSPDPATKRPPRPRGPDLPEKSGIKIKISAPSSLAGSEEPKDSEIDLSPSILDESLHETQQWTWAETGSAKDTSKSPAEEDLPPQTNQRKRKHHDLTEDADEIPAAELPAKPTRPRWTKKPKRPADTTEISPASKKKNPTTRTRGKSPQQGPSRVCDGLCLTFEEKIIAMYEIVEADPDNSPDTQAELDAAMLKYCKCAERQREDEEDKAPEGKIMLKFSCKRPPPEAKNKA